VCKEYEAPLKTKALPKAGSSKAAGSKAAASVAAASVAAASVAASSRNGKAPAPSVEVEVEVHEVEVEAVAVEEDEEEGEAAAVKERKGRDEGSAKAQALAAEEGEEDKEDEEEDGSGDDDRDRTGDDDTEEDGSSEDDDMLYFEEIVNHRTALDGTTMELCIKYLGGNTSKPEYIWQRYETVYETQPEALEEYEAWLLDEEGVDGEDEDEGMQSPPKRLKPSADDFCNDHPIMKPELARERFLSQLANIGMPASRCVCRCCCCHVPACACVCLRVPACACRSLPLTACTHAASFSASCGLVKIDTWICLSHMLIPCGPGQCD
jgi:hypothetical protein